MKIAIAQLFLATIMMVGCTTTVNEELPPTNDELVVTAEAVNVTDTTADIVVTVSKPATEYMISVTGAGDDDQLSSGGNITRSPTKGSPFLPSFVVSTGEKGISLLPDSEYLIFIYATDENGNLHSAHTSFRTLPTAMPTLQISGMSIVTITPQYSRDTTKAIRFDLNRTAEWQVQVKDWTIHFEFVYSYDDSKRSSGAVVPLYLSPGHNYSFAILAFTQEGESSIQWLDFGTW